MFQDVEWGLTLDNSLIGPPDIQEYEEPSGYISQLSSSPYFSRAPVYLRDVAQYDSFAFGDPQPGAAEDFLNSSFTLQSTTAPLASPKYSSPPCSPLTRLTINTPSSPLSPPPSVLPTQQTAPVPGRRAADPERSAQDKMPKKAPKTRSYTYKPLYIAPGNWDIFGYNSFGELEAGRTYSAQEIVRYLYSNPQHHVGETYNPKLGGLTLWIQRTPQDSTVGYGHTKAGLCRFKDCEHNKVIKAGEIRVAFDELTKYIPNLNPKHNAGYVHLCCLEKKLDFPMLCKDLEVKPEDRVLPLERKQKNPMIMQNRMELDHVQRFINFCNENGRAPLSYPGLGTLNDEIIRLGLSELRGNALDHWQKRGVEGDDEARAKKLHAKELLAKAKRDDARARMEPAKKRARVEDSEGKRESEEERPCKKLAREMLKSRSSPSRR